ncbi:MAG: hypothetical protein IJ713_01235 [Oscillibacter sp.]|nr:hypothetical protein [Oscillibacter sp.]
MSLSNDAVVKLRAEEKAGKYDRYASVMKAAVLEQLIKFCGQNEEFAEAVLQGGSFEDCMKAVAKGCGSAISDLDAYRKAAAFYFKGADVRMLLTIRLEGDFPSSAADAAPSPQGEGKKTVILNLEDFI